VDTFLFNFADIDQLNYKNARTRRKVIRNQKIAEKSIIMPDKSNIILSLFQFL